MQVVIVGAGAVGAYFGLKLAQGGVDVCFLVRPGRAADHEQHGLTLGIGGQTLAPPVQFSEDPGIVKKAALVLVCVKSGQTAEVARQLAGHLAPSTVVLSLQNGISNAGVLSQGLSRTVIPAAVYVAVQRMTPYRVEHRGRGELALSESWRSAPWVRCFEQGGIPLLWGASIDALLWEKLVMNCALNAVSALTDLRYGELASLPAMPQLFDALVMECEAVARAEGVGLPSDLRRRLDVLIAGMASQRSSTHADLKAGRASEIDAINGEIVRRAKTHALSVPANLALLALVQARDKVSAGLELNAARAP